LGLVIGIGVSNAFVDLDHRGIGGFVLAHSVVQLGGLFFSFGLKEKRRAGHQTIGR
jgi:hypothetical protein